MPYPMCKLLSKSECTTRGIPIYTVQPITKSIHTLRLPKYSHLAGHGSTAVDRALAVLRIACTEILGECRVFQFALRQLVGLL